jgi:hypothetical protein
MSHYILVRTDLEKQPKFINMMSHAINNGWDHPDLEAILLGCLVRFWSWVSITCTDSHLELNHPERAIDQIVRKEGFALLMKQTGWLEIDGNVVTIPEFDTWLSKSAKKLALQRARQRRYLIKRDAQASTEQNRTEQIHRNHSDKSQQGHAKPAEPDYLQAIQSALVTQGIHHEEATTCSLRLAAKQIPLETVLNRIYNRPQNLRSVTGWLIRNCEQQQE